MKFNIFHAQTISFFPLQETKTVNANCAISNQQTHSTKKLIKHKIQRNDKKIMIN